MDADLVCSFCGKGTTEVRRLVKGPGVAICDGCVRVSHEIIQGLDRDEAAEPEPVAAADEVMVAIIGAQQAALDGDRVQARREFEALWERIGPDGDPLHRVTLAHYMADIQDDPQDELEWDRRALAAADSLTDDRAQEYHATLAVRGFYASLYLNLAADYEKLGQWSSVQEHLDRAQESTVDLPEGGYGDLIRSGIAALRDRLAQHSTSDL